MSTWHATYFVALASSPVDDWLDELLDDPQALHRATAKLVESLEDARRRSAVCDRVEADLLDRALDRMMLRAQTELIAELDAVPAATT